MIFMKILSPPFTQLGSNSAKGNDKTPLQPSGLFTVEITLPPLSHVFPSERRALHDHDDCVQMQSYRNLEGIIL